ncbi:Winged helix-turn-helix [uncultured archaeon]|nr:Winged helix-turn-helix [uncultured archaeon]
MKRTKEQIIASVLETCLIGANKTVIVYKSNLNFRTAIPYIDSLTKRGFIDIIEGPTRMYKTTDRGKELLSGLKEIHDLFL